MHTGLSETNYSEGGATATGDCLLPLLLAFPNSEPEPGWGEVVSDSDCSQFGVWRNDNRGGIAIKFGQNLSLSISKSRIITVSIKKKKQQQQQKKTKTLQTMLVSLLF